MQRKTLEESVEIIKNFLGDKYDSEKYIRKNLIGIRLTKEIKKELLRDIENKYENINLKKCIENIIEKNINKYINLKEFAELKNYKAYERFSIELTFNTLEKAIEIKKNSNIKSINKLINLILYDYLNNKNKEVIIIDYKKEIKE